MGNVRRAVEADIPAILELGAALHAESPRYSRMPYSPKKVARTAMFLIGAGGALVAESEGKIIGFMGSMVSEHWFSEAKIASEISFYVTPEHRLRGAAPRLLRTAEEWARGEGAEEIVTGTSTEINADTTALFYEKMGYARTGYQFAKRL